eukprot:8095517-Alexandrium_andersonii.AAC.1
MPGADRGATGGGCETATDEVSRTTTSMSGRQTAGHVPVQSARHATAARPFDAFSFAMRGAE